MTCTQSCCPGPRNRHDRGAVVLWTVSRAAHWVSSVNSLVRSSPPSEEDPLIFITAKFRVLPEHADDWPTISNALTQATRAEPGCLWFDWSRSLDDSDEYILVEAFIDSNAGAAHVGSAHFTQACTDLPPYLGSEQ